MRVIGLMSGTSADGIDTAIIDINDRCFDLVAFDTFAYPAKLKKTIFKLFQANSVSLEDICHYNFVLGEIFAKAVIQLCSEVV